MSGEPDIYYTYRDVGPNRQLVELHMTQAAANAAANAAGADVSAWASSVPLTDGVRVGWIYDAGEGYWRLPVAADLSLVDQLKNGALAYHDQLRATTDYIIEVGHYYSSSLVGKAHDLTTYQHYGARSILLSTDWTAQTRLTWLAQARLGPTDIPADNRAAIFSVVAALTDAQVPISRVFAADPTTGVGWPTNQMVINSADVSGGVGEPTDISEYHDCEWRVNIPA